MVHAPQRILIVSVNWLGDLLFMTPAIRAIRKAYPKSHIACLVAPRGVEFLEGNPHLNEVIPLPESRGLFNLVHLWRAAFLLRPKRFDTAFLFHRSFSRTLMTALAGISSRIGYRTWKRSWLLTQSQPMPAADSLHKAVWFLNLLEKVGIPSDGLHYDSGVSPENEARVGELLSSFKVQSEDRLVALHVGANWKLKRWPVHSFAQLADGLAHRYGVRVLFVGGAGDQELIQRITDRMSASALVAAGQTSFRELGALLRRTKLLISNDSGPLHMGLAVGTPVVALFGPTEPKLTGPPNGAKATTLFGSIGCPVPCYELKCPVNLCLQKISPDEVLDAAGKFLSK